MTEFKILKFVAADLNFKSHRADMKCLATAQAGETAGVLACRARVHEKSLPRLKVGSGVLRSFVAANLQCKRRTSKSMYRKRCDELFGTQCFAWTCFCGARRVHCGMFCGASVL